MFELKIARRPTHFNLEDPNDEDLEGDLLFGDVSEDDNVLHDDYGDESDTEG